MSLNIQELFNKAVEKFDGDKWGEEDGIISFDLTGEKGIQYTAIIAGKKLVVEKGLDENADLLVRISQEDLSDLIDGKVNPMAIFAGGKMQLEGDKMMALKMLQLFGK